MTEIVKPGKRNMKKGVYIGTVLGPAVCLTLKAPTGGSILTSRAQKMSSFKILFFWGGPSEVLGLVKQLITDKNVNMVE